MSLFSLTVRELAETLLAFFLHINACWVRFYQNDTFINNPITGNMAHVRDERTAGVFDNREAHCIIII